VTHTDDGPLRDDDPERLRDRLTRRRFVTTGAVLGAAVVWGAPFPFVDKKIGADIASAAGPTGPTGPASSTSTPQEAPTGGTGPEAPTSTGTTGPTGPDYLPDRVVIDGLRDVRSVKVTRADVRFAQRFVEPGSASWVVDLSWWDQPATGSHRKAKALHRLRRVGTAQRKINGAGSVEVTVKLTKAGRELIERHPNGKLFLRTTFTDGRGRKLPSNWLLRGRA
jgi:hypothetical protein